MANHQEVRTGLSRGSRGVAWRKRRLTSILAEDSLNLRALLGLGERQHQQDARLERRVIFGGDRELRGGAAARGRLLGDRDGLGGAMRPDPVRVLVTMKTPFSAA